MSEKLPGAQVPGSLSRWLKEQTFEIGLPDRSARVPVTSRVRFRAPTGGFHLLVGELGLGHRKTRQRASHKREAPTEKRMKWPFGRSKRRKIDRNPFKLPQVSRTLVSCHGIQKIIGSKRYSGNQPNDSDAANGNNRCGFVFICNCCGRIMGIEHVIDFPDCDRLSRRWSDCKAAHRCDGRKL